MAEKAYAQWNQTGNAGRNGANTFAAIEGGWMATVYAQVTGKNATDYWFNNTPKQTLINALKSGQSVTLGTKTGALGGGLVQGHAYMVKGYDAATDKFTLHNPWGTSHPTPLYYTQLQQFCSVFVVANASGTSPIAQLQSKTNVRNDMYMEALAVTVNQQRTVAESDLADDEVSSPLNGEQRRWSLTADSQDASDLVDIESAMLDQIRRDIGELQDYVGLTLNSSESELALTAAIDEVFAQPSLFN